MIISFTLVIFLSVYRPTLFNFFLGDDFGNTTWAKAAASHPELLWDGYWWFPQDLTVHSPNTDILVYRPLQGTALFLKYVLWGDNALYSRLANMFFELLSGIMLGLFIIMLGRTSAQDSLSNKQLCTWAMFSTVLFILFPLHSEPVNSISDITDPLVVLFSLLTLWCYIQWRNRHALKYFILSIVSVVLAFLAKEYAATLPLTIFVYECLFGSHVCKSSFQVKHPGISAARQSFIRTLPYWVVLFLYFGVRKICLGSFIAGYPDGVCNPTIDGWLHGLSNIFIPINTAGISTHSYVFKLWHVVLTIGILLTIITTLKANEKVQKIIFFLAVWSLLYFAPACKIFSNMMSTGSGSRLIYPATPALCTLLTFGLAIFCVGRRFYWIYRIIALTFFIVAAMALHGNNLVWSKAGLQTNRIVQQLKSYYKTIKGDPWVYITGVPVYYKNIYASPLTNITGSLVMDRPVTHCIPLDRKCLRLSPGIFKNIVNTNSDQISLLYWDAKSEEIKPVLYPNRNAVFYRKWLGNALSRIIHISAIPTKLPLQVLWQPDGILDIKSYGKSNGFVMLELDIADLPCWYIDFLALKLQFIDLGDFPIPAQAHLRFTNNIATNYSMETYTFNCCHAPIKAGSEEQTLIFPLHNMSAWTMGGKCSHLQIILPIGKGIKISQFYVPEVEKLMPRIKLQQSIDEPPGEVRLDTGHESAHMQYDASAISNCKNIMLEIVPADQSFATVDYPSSSAKFFLRRKMTGISGQLTFNRAEFPVGVFTARIEALNDKNNQLGFPSDTFLIFVD